MARYQQSDTRWTPKNGSTVLDTVGPDYLPHFRFALTRNGHVVSMYLYESAAITARDERRQALPLDTWEVGAR